MQMLIRPTVAGLATLVTLCGCSREDPRGPLPRGGLNTERVVYNQPSPLARDFPLSAIAFPADEKSPQEIGAIGDFKMGEPLILQGQISGIREKPGIIMLKVVTLTKIRGVDVTSQEATCALQPEAGADALNYAIPFSIPKTPGPGRIEVSVIQLLPPTEPGRDEATWKTTCVATGTLHVMNPPH